MKGIKLNILLGVLFVSVMGTLLHFAYSVSGESWLVGLFAPINESIWEHTKLAFFPMLLYTGYLCKKCKPEYPCIQSAMLSAALLSVILIIVLFYTYSGMLGFHVAFADISIFYISVLLAFYAAYALTISCKAEKWKMVLRLLTILMVLLFFLFTFSPPNIPLFVSP